MSSILDRLLDNAAMALVARIVLTFMFWSAGIGAIVDFPGWTAEMSYFGLEPAIFYAVATAVWLLVGSALIILDRAAWLGCGLLAVFTLLTIPLVHHFWTMAEPVRTSEFHVVVEHVTVIGGLMVAAVLSHRRQSQRSVRAAAAE